MVKVTFKDVGQGDSIVFEWETAGIKKFGLIDCRKYEGANPTLEHLKESGISEIAFIVLSHPHEDHYSGLFEIFKHCKDSKIKIKGFYHTLKDVGIEYSRFFSPNITGGYKLVELFDIVQELYEMNILVEIIPLNSGSRIDLIQESDVYLKCLSPSFAENQAYLNILKYEPEQNRMLRSRAANYLSTFFKLKIQDQYYLFTSDVEKITFTRIQERNWDIFDNKKIYMSQVPHHGSENNHDETFWNRLDRIKECQAVISSGDHKTYAHPDYSVVESFMKLGYKIYATNLVHGLADFVNEIKLKSLKLDTSSNLAEEYYYTGDKEFILPLN